MIDDRVYEYCKGLYPNCNKCKIKLMCIEWNKYFKEYEKRLEIEESINKYFFENIYKG